MAATSSGGSTSIATGPSEILAQQDAKRVHVRQVGGDDESCHAEAGLLLKPGLTERCACQTMSEIVHAGPSRKSAGEKRARE
jgi:hypothetical protein